MFNFPTYRKSTEAWTGRILVDPFAIPATELVAKTPLTPNQVTIFSFLISLVSAYFYFRGLEYFLVGAIIWQISFIFDGLDGMLARKTNRTSEFGAKLDTRLDKVKKILNLAAILYAYRAESAFVLLVAIVLIHYGMRFWKYQKNETIINALNNRGVKEIFDPLDEQCFMLFLGPLFNLVPLFWGITLAMQTINRLVHTIANKRTSTLSQ
jgi:phosphatidylglycerophosphate synthase